MRQLIKKMMQGQNRFTSLFTGLVMLLVSAMPSVTLATQSVTYYHWDALGSPVAASDESGNLKWREQYQPYGERIQNQAAAQSNSRWFTGHPHDNATGLTYMGARWYDPAVGRFYAIDPADFDEDEPESFNRYSYVGNNPYKYVDPDGQVKVNPNDMVGLGGGPGGLIMGGGGIGGPGGMRALPAPSTAGRIAPNTAGTSAARAVPQARLTQPNLEHIVERHWATSSAKGAGKFAPETRLTDLRRMIRETVEKGTPRANTGGRPGTIFEHDFGRSIGTDIGGNASSRLRVVVQPDSIVTTAFPY